MSSNSKYHKNYTEFGEPYQLVLPLNLEGADSGYESEEGYTYLREQKQKPYIKLQTYEKWKRRNFKKDISKRENMGYDEATDIYTCHAGKKLRPLFIKKQKSDSFFL